jgi:hypothetical protein
LIPDIEQPALLASERDADEFVGKRSAGKVVDSPRQDMENVGSFDFKVRRFTMTLREHNKTAIAIARVDVFFSALALPQSPSTSQLQQATTVSAAQQRLNDSRRTQ